VGQSGYLSGRSALRSSLPGRERTVRASALFLCMVVAPGDEAKNADQIRDEMIEIIKAWPAASCCRRRSVLLLGLLSEFGPVRGVP
jgi:hypothetical protein